MIPKAGYRGQPVFMLVAVLGSWVAARAAMWQPELGDRDPPPAEDVDAPSTASAPRTAVALARLPRLPTPAAGASDHGGFDTGPGTGLPPRWSASLRPEIESADQSPSAAGEVQAPRPAQADFTPAQEPTATLASAQPRPAITTTPAYSVPTQDPVAVQEISQLSDPAPLAAPFPPVAPSAKTIAPGARRWSGDFWLLLREDTTTAVTSGRGSYGQSQLGGVLRYNLAPSSAHRPAAYVRASQALAGAEESEVAAGLAARPLPSVPVTVAAELRATLVNGQVELRPAAFAYTELAPCNLPLGFTGEAYVQAGYVGGDFATAFADGQLRAEREIVRLGAVTLSAGGGAWGGAQKGAERLDLGPGTTFKLDAGLAAARVSLDWRFRVAGDAEPSSGPTLTISAGF